MNKKGRHQRSHRDQYDPTRISFIVKYDTPTVQKIEDFSSLEAAEDWAGYITAAPLSRVHNAMVLSVGTQIISHHSRKEA